MFNFVCSLWKRSGWLLALLALVSLCGCGSLVTSQASPTPTPRTQTAFTSSIGKWEVHDALLTITANHTGLEQWNGGPCSPSSLCNGTARITFAENADGSLKGTIQSVSYSQWDGQPAPAGYQPNAADPQAADTFQLQHSGTHLLYTTWFGHLTTLNTTNRYWCDSYALKAGFLQCGA